MTKDLSKTKVGKVFMALESLEVNDQIDRDKFITEHWGECNYFIIRSFDVAFYTAKQMLLDKKFKVRKRQICRIV